MRVTDEMVDAAIAADSHASWWAGNSREGAEKRMRAALEAALAVEGTEAEPVAWTQPSCLSEVAVGNGGYIWGKRDMAEVREFIAKTGGSNIPDDIPLYTIPPAGIREALEEQYVVWSHEHSAWWRPNSAGYAQRLEDAGVYSRDDALCISHKGRDSWLPDEAPDELPIRLTDLPDWALAALRGQS